MWFLFSSPSDYPPDLIVFFNLETDTIRFSVLLLINSQIYKIQHIKYNDLEHKLLHDISQYKRKAPSLNCDQKDGAL
jgi:hypothetical protein